MSFLPFELQSITNQVGLRKDVPPSQVTIHHTFLNRWYQSESRVSLDRSTGVQTQVVISHPEYDSDEKSQSTFQYKAIVFRLKQSKGNISAEQPLEVDIGQIRIETKSFPPLSKLQSMCLQFSGTTIGFLSPKELTRTEDENTLIAQFFSTDTLVVPWGFVRYNHLEVVCYFDSEVEFEATETKVVKMTTKPMATLFSRLEETGQDWDNPEVMTEVSCTFRNMKFPDNVIRICDALMGLKFGRDERSHAYDVQLSSIRGTRQRTSYDAEWSSVVDENGKQVLV